MVIDIGKGNLYNTKKFNMIVVWFGRMICLGSTIYIGFVSYQQISRQMRSYDPTVNFIFVILLSLSFTKELPLSYKYELLVMMIIL